MESILWKVGVKVHDFYADLIKAPFTLRQNDLRKCFTENTSSRKRSSNQRNFENARRVLVWTGNILKTELFKIYDVAIIMWLTLTLQGALKRFCRLWLACFQISPV